MKYTIQIMDTDFNTIEFVIEAEDKEAAMSLAFADIKAEDVAMSAVFEEGCNISLPCEPVDRFCLPPEYTHASDKRGRVYPLTKNNYTDIAECIELDISPVDYFESFGLTLHVGHPPLKVLVVG